MSQPRRKLSIYDKGRNTYNILDDDDKTHLYKVHFTSRTSPNLTIFQTSGQEQLVGRATYQTVKRFGFLKTPNIHLHMKGNPTSVSIDKEPGLFNFNKRILHSATLGQLHFRTRVGDNPWKAGAPETTFMSCTNEAGLVLAVYREEEYDIKRMGHLEVEAGLKEEALDEVVMSSMAVVLVTTVM